MSNTIRLSLLASLAALAAPGIASADSIVYVDGGNVWSARPDGTARVQLTDGGDWHDPTQSDDGTIAAVKGLDTIYVLAHDGRPLHTMTTPFGVRSGDGGTFSNRPVDLALSPDGRRLAYSYVAYSCPPGSTCGTIQRATFFTETALTAASETYGTTLGVGAPSWVSNDRVMTFGGYLRNVNFHDLGASGPAKETNWFPNEADTKDGEISPDHRFLAMDLFYGADTQLAVIPITGDPATGVPPKPQQVLCYFGPDAKLAGATWSPDSTGLAYVSSDGIEVARFARLGSDGCALQNGQTVDFSRTGTQPDWGPADPPAARYGGPPAAPVGPPAPGPGTAPAIEVRIGGPRRLAVRHGRVTLRCAAPLAQRCRIELQVQIGGKSMRTSGTGGAGPIRLRFSGRSARRVAGALQRRALHATATATATSSDGRIGQATRLVTLVR